MHVNSRIARPEWLRCLAACALAVIAATLSCGQSSTSAPGGPVYHAAGVVVWVNADAGSIKIDHEDIKDLMPAMAMKFVVRDKALLNGINASDRVEFDVVEATEGYVITAIKKSGA
jgi:Cu/Ag efflux protein CusF